MMNELKKYPVYMDSGVPWLGEVPDHWMIRRGKWLFRSKKELNTGRRQTNVLSLTMRGVVNNNPNDPEGMVPKDYATYQLFHKDDLVFKLIDLENLKTSRVGLVHEDGIMSSAYVRLASRSNGNIRFFFQQYFDLYQRGIYNQIGAGVRSTLGTKDLLEVSVLVPPRHEQSSIVRFLDHADRRIKRCILAKQKMIKLLEDQKQAIIHQAVTRGLDPGVRLKPSSVEWLGDVPEHWEIRRLRNISQMMVSNVDKLTEANEIPVRLCNYVDVYKNDRITEKLSYMHATASADEVEHFRLKVGDVLITKDSEDWKDIGVPALVAYSASDFVCGYHLAIIRPHDRIVFGGYLLRAMQSRGVALQFHVVANGVTRYGLSQDAIKNILLPIPPIVEQLAITQFLDEATTDILTTINHAHDEIALLREYRTRLIADVVTGKLDVREAAKNLPEGLDEMEKMAEPDVSDEGQNAVNEEGITEPEEIEA